jgi:hypothetical protein
MHSRKRNPYAGALSRVPGCEASACDSTSCESNVGSVTGARTRMVVVAYELFIYVSADILFLISALFVFLFFSLLFFEAGRGKLCE